MTLRKKSALKRVRSSAKRHARNLTAKISIKQAFKTAHKAVVGRTAGIAELVNKAFSAVDKAVERGIVHRNKAARQKSRLAKKARSAQA